MNIEKFKQLLLAGKCTQDELDAMVAFADENSVEFNPSEMSVITDKSNTGDWVAPVIKASFIGTLVSVGVPFDTEHGSAVSVDFDITRWEGDKNLTALWGGGFSCGLLSLNLNAEFAELLQIGNTFKGNIVEILPGVTTYYKDKTIKTYAGKRRLMLKGLKSINKISTNKVDNLITALSRLNVTSEIAKATAIGMMLQGSNDDE